MFWQQQNGSTFASRNIAAIALLAFCYSNLPLPIPRLSTVSPDGVPFPCQNCPCGCSSALQCWTTCCCYTPEERLAWAEERGIEPPEYAIVASKPSSKKASPKAACSHCAKQSESKENSCSVVSVGVGVKSKQDQPISITAEEVLTSNSPKAVGTARAMPACCASRIESSGCIGCEKKTSTIETVCQSAKCESPTTADSDVCTVEAKESESSTIGFTLSLFSAKCRGQATEFTNLPWFIPFTASSAPFYDLTPCDHLVAPGQSRSNLFLGPEPPPPRLFTVV